MFVVSGPAFAGGLVDTDFTAFSAADFTTNDSSVIDNPWWTLAAGSKVLYYAEEEEECLWNLIEDFGVLINGFTGGDFSGDYAMDKTRIILDREWVDESDDCDENSFEDVYDGAGELDEVTYDWYAQDYEKNIWYMGEDTWDGESKEGSFAAGCDGAEAGIVVMGGMPDKGTFYQQEFYEEEAEDWGKVLNYIEMDDMVCMKTKEWTPLEPGEVEHKYYCSDGETGMLVLIEELHGKTVYVEPYEGGFVPPPPPGGGPPNPVPECDLD
jgi:hypothetical protein